VVDDQDVAHLHQLAWSPDGTRLLLSEGSHINGPVYDELYIQQIPVPVVHLPALVFPGWFAHALGLLPKLWVSGGVLLVLLMLVALLVLLRQRVLSRRSRVLIRWTLVAGPLLCGAVVLSFGSLATWLGQLYRFYSPSLCESSPTLTCTTAGALSVLTVTGPLAVLALVVLFGVLIAGRPRPAPAPTKIVPAPVRPPQWLPQAPGPFYAASQEKPRLLPPGRTEEAQFLEPLPPWDEDEVPE
jgi:hypothetical protein